MYATPEDVRRVLSPDGQQDDYETAAGFDDAALEDALKRATAKVHTYLSKQYALPVNTAEYDTDGVMNDWVSVIAAYFATLTFSRGQDIGTDDPIRLRYNDVMKTLERVQSGNLPLPWPPEADVSANNIAIVNRYEGDMFRPDDFNLGPEGRPWNWGTVPGYSGPWGF
ncbi:MAG TPA: phage protein Gp36 family protein [Nocardioides sp.]|nr:phage protein Gp36 family protein [Nocardioides sp.]